MSNRRRPKPRKEPRIAYLAATEDGRWLLRVDTKADTIELSADVTVRFDGETGAFVGPSASLDMDRDAGLHVVGKSPLHLWRLAHAFEANPEQRVWPMGDFR